GVRAWPTASQPERPRTTLTSAALRHDVGSSTSAGDHRPPGEASHRAGAPLAAPAATRVRPAVARALTVMSGVAAAARTDCPTGPRPPPPGARREGRGGGGPGWVPATPTLPPGAGGRPAPPPARAGV